MKVENKIINGIPQTFLYAENGMIATNGRDVFGKDIRLAEGVSEYDFYEITEGEYEKIIAMQEEMANDI